VLAALVLAAVGTPLFVLLPSPTGPGGVGRPARPPGQVGPVEPAGPAAGRRPGETGGPAPVTRSVLRIPGVGPILASAVGLGGVFGASDVALVAFGRDAGWGAAAGVLPAVLTLASLCSGTVYGVIRWRTGLDRRLAVAAAALAAATLLFPLAGGPPVVVLCAVITGVPIAPVVINSNAIVGDVVPAHRRTEGFTWLVIANCTGVAVMSPVTGAVVDAAGVTAGMALIPAAGLTVAAFALLAASRLGRRAETVIGTTRHGAAER
jgi:MFS family permease